MCSTPKGSGTTIRVKRFVDDGCDYASYSKMLRRASDRLDQCDEKRKRKAELQASSEGEPKEIEPELPAKRVSIRQQRPARETIVSRLLSHLNVSWNQG